MKGVQLLLTILIHLSLQLHITMAASLYLLAIYSAFIADSHLLLLLAIYDILVLAFVPLLFF